MKIFLKSAAALAIATLLAPCISRAATEFIFVDGYNTGNVYKIAPDGTSTVFASGIPKPGGMAFDANQNLYVASLSGQDIIKITPSGAQSIYSGAITQAPFPDAAHYFGAAGIVFDPSGNLFVVSHNETGGVPINNYINKIAPGGGSGTSAVSVFATVPKASEDLAFDGAGNLYVTNYYYNQGISKVAPDGTVTGFYADNTQNSIGLAFDRNGDLFVSNFGNGDGVTPNGSIIEFLNIGGVLSNSPTLFASGLVDPHGLAFDSAGNLFAIEFTPGILLEFQSTGGVLNHSPSVYATGLPSGNNIVIGVQAVPEPSTWALMFAGLFGIGAALRYRRTASAPAR